ncbi:MAG: ATP-binding response regulator [Acidiferrobacteraceae bacterium]
MQQTEQRELVNELLTLHARILLRMPAFQVLLIGAMGWIALPDISGSLFAIWATFALAAEVLRSGTAHWALRRLPVSAPQRMYRGFVALDALSGLSIGSAAVLFLPHAPLLSQMLIEIVLFAVAAAGTAVAVSSAFMLAAYSSMVLVGASGTWVFLHPSLTSLVIVLTLAYWIFLVAVARDSERLLLRSIRIRHERDQALQSLERSDAELRAAHERIERAMQARNRVMAAASHDLRQPLQTLSIYSAVLSAHPQPQTMSVVGKNIENIVRDLGEILDELLDLSSLASGSYRIQQTVFALDEVIAGVCTELALTAGRKGLALTTHLAPVQMQGDSRAASRIARNLIDNAIKYTASGCVRVSVDMNEGHAILAVEDTGRGIPGSEQEHVFEEFYQLQAGDDEYRGGVGLGLAIVKRLCELTRATITIHSEPGTGTRMTVMWTGLAIGRMNPPERVTGQMRLSHWRGRRVYVLDDDQEVVRSLCALLETWGLSVRGAGSAHDLQELVSVEGCPDVLIADLHLGHNQSGLAVAERLVETQGPLPVLIITADTAAVPLSAGDAPSWLTLMQKPVSSTTLQAALDTFFAELPEPAKSRDPAEIEASLECKGAGATQV